MAESIVGHEPAPGCDVVVVGGGAAGLAAAVQLARSRRSVVVVDAGEPRNAPAAHMHSYLGHDGLPPAEFLAIARAEVRAYGAEIVEGAATTITENPAGDGFDVLVAGAGVITGRRVLVATGLVDELPDIPGVAEQWGRGVIHCPYCHGWEVRDRPIAVIATGPLSAHQALLFRQLSDHVTVIVHAPPGVSAEDRPRLVARGVRIEDGPVAAVVIDDDQVRGVRLGDGRVIDADAVVVSPRFVARSEPLRALGITPVPAPRGAGEMIATDAAGATTVAGVYAAGNVADVRHQVLQAAAEGGRVAAAINADLADEDASLAVDALVGDGAEHWDRRYAGTSQWWSGQPNAALVAEIGDAVPGSALDVGCGEGADALWLARRGWDVTAVDISQVALDRARRAADEAGVKVDWIRADVTLDAPDPDRYDLVSVQYPALPRGAGDDAIPAILGAVAPGGTLLFVGHAFDRDSHRHHGHDPSNHVQPDDVVGHLGPEWTVQVHEHRPRTWPPGHNGPDVADVVLRARRA
jgi:thioredoxin reductase